ncbi:DNA-cytosine methyltransferase [Pseudomonas putida]|nr:DNA-cytosine methyltransferase [Pseudomonas putida]
MREGLADPRGALTIKYVELLDAIDHVRTKRGRARGHLSLGKTSPASSPNKGNAFGCFLGALVGESEELNRQGANGRTLVVCMDPRETVDGGFWMPNISAWPNDAAVCSLSQVLEQGSIPSKYFLSAKACAGILRRAEARGKTLPAPLMHALKAVASLEQMEPQVAT